VAITQRTDRPGALARAGIQVIAAQGIRALTHRAVDHEAGLPSGTASYHFSTRKDLVRAILEEIAAVSRHRLAEPPTPAAETMATHRATGSQQRQAAAERISRVCGDFIVGQLTTYRQLTIARYALQAEVATDPDLAEILHTADQFQTVATEACRALNVDDPATTGRHLLAFVDGIVHDQLVGASSLRNHRPDQVGTAAASAIEAYLTGLPARAE
jgi:DNA-binding transcriptional regulator YbjK